MKILGTVIGNLGDFSSVDIVGFIAEVTEDEFSRYYCKFDLAEEQLIIGEFLKANTCKEVRNKIRVVSNLFATFFSNSQIEIISHSNFPENIKEKSRFRLNKLPVVLFVDGKAALIGNAVRVMTEVFHKVEHVGFIVKVGSNGERFVSDTGLIRYCKVFEPMNFSIRWQNSKPKFILPELPKLDVQFVDTVLGFKKMASNAGYKGVSSFTEIYSALMLLQLLTNTEFDDLLNLDIKPGYVITNFGKNGIISGSRSELLDLYKWADKNLPVIARENGRPFGDAETMVEFLGLEMNNVSLAFALACYIFGSKDEIKFINELFSVEALVQKFGAVAQKFILSFNQYAASTSSFAESLLHEKQAHPVKPIDVRVWLSIPDKI